jgi:hypothetical protein
MNEIVVFGVCDYYIYVSRMKKKEDETIYAAIITMMLQQQVF